jgi:hypothetical protein
MDKSSKREGPEGVINDNEKGAASCKPVFTVEMGKKTVHVRDGETRRETEIILNLLEKT